MLIISQPPFVRRQHLKHNLLIDTLSSWLSVVKNRKQISAQKDLVLELWLLSIYRGYFSDWRKPQTRNNRPRQIATAEALDTVQ